MASATYSKRCATDELFALNYLWGLHEIHFKQSCLQVSLILSIVFQRVEQKCCGLLNEILFEEDIDYLCQISHRFRFLDEQLGERERIRHHTSERAEKKVVYLSKLNALLRIDSHNASK